MASTGIPSNWPDKVETWRKLRFSTNDLANPAVSGDQAGPDGDGIPNRAECFLGLEPQRVDRSPLAIEKTGLGADGGVTLSFELLAVTAEVDFLRFEVSTDLVNWAPTTPERSGTGPGRDPSMKRVGVFFRSGAEQQRFFRLGFAGSLP